MIRILIVDDEEPARINLRRLLETDSGVDIVGEAGNGIEALEQIPDLRPDVVFLDIEMPGLNGFEVASNLVNPPLIVFATAYDEFAVKAFEQNALDYILKPVQAKRISQTLGRVRIALGSDRSEYDGALKEVLGLVERERGAPVTKLAGRRGKRIIVLSVAEVTHLRIEDKLVFAHLGKERYLVEKTVGELERMLQGVGFYRINRGELVNLEHVRELLPWFSGTYRVKLHEGTELDVSRDRAKGLLQLMGV
jgi:two-component system LytT family response regulator/two-component system response regulator LytT